ncbi:hypothetical protein [Streptomyces sp. NPDC018584]|uniref:hypothetical protein n=1 Tax=unclassified Streptomyces TaxID=2593676 RepID=UPI0037BAC1F7
MATRFRLSTTDHLHHLMVDATTTPDAVVPNRVPGRLGGGFALSLVLDEADLTSLRTAVQAPDASVLKTRLTDMTNSYEQVKKAREADKARITNLGADHARVVSQLRRARRDHDDSLRKDAATIIKLTDEVSALKKAVEQAERNQRAAEIGRQEYKNALAEQKQQYSNLRLEHRALSDGYQRIVGQNAKFMTASSRPMFSFDAAMNRELDRLRGELKATQAQRDAARADARSSKAAYEDLLNQWEKQ